MKNTKIKTVKGTLILESISFDKVIKKKAIKNNETSAKVILPKGLEGKEVFVVWAE